MHPPPENPLFDKDVASIVRRTRRSEVGNKEKASHVRPAVSDRFASIEEQQNLLGGKEGPELIGVDANGKIDEDKRLGGEDGVGETWHVALVGLLLFILILGPLAPILRTHVSLVLQRPASETRRETSLSSPQTHSQSFRRDTVCTISLLLRPCLTALPRLSSSPPNSLHICSIFLHEGFTQPSTSHRTAPTISQLTSRYHPKPTPNLVRRRGATGWPYSSG